MIDRYPILACILVCVLTGYLCFAIPATARMADADTFSDCRISVADSIDSHFVSVQDVSRECGDILKSYRTRPSGDFDLNAIETALLASDKIERANVCVLNDNTLSIEVVPMVPVARVFDTDGSSYYINSEGKRISADPRYHVDVPVVVGRFTTDRPAARLLPMLGKIAAVPELDALVSTVKQARNGDIIIVPSIRGHVVNFGDTADVMDKFDRLRQFYRAVMPVKGWETYDTVSVKWRGRVVATRRVKQLAQSAMAAVTEDFDDVDDTGTMSTPLHEADSEADPALPPLANEKPKS